MAKHKQKNIKQESEAQRADGESKPPATPAINTSLINKLLISLFILYAVGVVFGVISHESWGDEAQPWLLARDASLADLFSILPSEGHPPLWYLVLFPFAKLGFPYETVKWVSAIIMIAAVFILLFRTNANIAIKLFIPFSYFFFYKYTVFGRSYSMIAFFLIAIIALYPKRFEKPFLFALCVVLLYNTHMLIFSFAFCLSLLYLVDAIQLKQLNKNTMIAFAIMCIGGLYLIPYLTNSQMANYFEKESFDHAHNIKYAIQNALTIADNTEALSIGILGILILLLAGRTKIVLLLLGGIAGILYIVGYRYSFAQTRHFGVLFIIIICCYCLAEFYVNDKMNIKAVPASFIQYGCWLCALLGIIQTSVSINNFREDFNNMYSGSKDAAEFIRDNHLDQSIIIGEPYWAAMSALPYLPKSSKIYNAGCGRFDTYYVYDSCYMRKTGYRSTSCVKVGYNTFQNRLRDITFLVDFKINLKQAPFLELIYQTPEMPIYKSEQYFIYRFTDYIITRDSIKNHPPTIKQ